MPWSVSTPSDDRVATRRSRRLWLVPLLLLLHNVEEALTVGPVLPLVNARLAATFPGRLPSLSYPEYLIALALATALPFIVAAAGELRQPGSRAGYVLLIVQATLLLNVVSHLGAAALPHGYAPGLVTAVVVNLPFSLVLLSQAWREHWYRRRALTALAPAALLVHGPGVIRPALGGRVVTPGVRLPTCARIDFGRRDIRAGTGQRHVEAVGRESRRQRVVLAGT